MTNTTTLTPMQKERNDRLLIAAKNSNIDRVKEFIDNGADVDAKNKNEKTAQEIATENDHHQIVELIENAKKEVRIPRSDIDILNMDMDELVRRADESAKRLCRKE